MMGGNDNDFKPDLNPKPAIFFKADKDGNPGISSSGSYPVRGANSSNPVHPASSNPRNPGIAGISTAVGGSSGNSSRINISNLLNRRL